MIYTPPLPLPPYRSKWQPRLSVWLYVYRCQPSRADKSRTLASHESQDHRTNLPTDCEACIAAAAAVEEVAFINIFCLFHLSARWLFFTFFAPARALDCVSQSIISRNAVNHPYRLVPAQLSVRLPSCRREAEGVISVSQCRKTGRLW